MSATVNQLRAITDADRQWFTNHPRRRHRTRQCSIEEVMATPPFASVPEQPYSAVLRRISGGFQKLIAPEVIIAGLAEKRAAAVSYGRRAGGERVSGIFISKR